MSTLLFVIFLPDAPGKISEKSPFRLLGRKDIAAPNFLKFNPKETSGYRQNAIRCSRAHVW